MDTTVEVNQTCRNGSNTGAAEILCVTSDGRWCTARINDHGAVCVFGGSIWPGELPAVFVSGPRCAQFPCNVALNDAVKAHFAKSVAPMRLPLAVAA